MTSNDAPNTYLPSIAIDALRLVAWLRLHGVRVERRVLSNAGNIQYHFVDSELVHDLIAQWNNKSQSEIELMRFASFLAYETRLAYRIRRKASAI